MSKTNSRTQNSRLQITLEKHGLIGHEPSNYITVPEVNKAELLERLGYISECECEGSCDLEKHKAHIWETAERITNEPLVIPFGDRRV